LADLGFGEGAEFEGGGERGCRGLAPGIGVGGKRFDEKGGAARNQDAADFGEEALGRGGFGEQAGTGDEVGGTVGDRKGAEVGAGEGDAGREGGFPGGGRGDTDEIGGGVDTGDAEVWTGLGQAEGKDAGATPQVHQVARARVVLDAGDDAIEERSLADATAPSGGGGELGLEGG
jgi:hypothetical protein